MDYSLILSHLPDRFSRHRALDLFKEAKEPPTPAALAHALCENGCNARDTWAAINTACRLAESTQSHLPKLGIFAVNFWSLNYPAILRWYDNPPWMIFWRGELPVARPTLAVVGSRKPNLYGEELLASFIPQLMTRPLQIISGLAYGVDSLAHFHALQSGIPNFAVLGCGLDQIYPAGHFDLAQQIIRSGGGLLSEYPPGTEPLPYHFPKRNRIISALADVLWIVQGTAKSGSLHTVKHGLDQGKTIATTPGDVFSELSQLPNRLAMDGAQMVTSPSDLDLLLENSRQARLTH